MATTADEGGGFSLFGSLNNLADSFAVPLVKADAIATRINEFGTSDVVRQTNALRAQQLQQQYLDGLNGTSITNSLKGINSNTLLIGGALLGAYLLSS